MWHVHSRCKIYTMDIYSIPSNCVHSCNNCSTPFFKWMTWSGASRISLCTNVFWHCGGTHFLHCPNNRLLHPGSAHCSSRSSTNNLPMGLITESGSMEAFCFLGFWHLRVPVYNGHKTWSFGMQSNEGFKITPHNHHLDLTNAAVTNKIYCKHLEQRNSQ